MIVVTDDFVVVASAPDGKEYAIFIAPPGSALDSDGPQRGGPLGLLIGVWDMVRRAGSSQWRIALQERLADGRLGPIAARWAFATEDQARSRADELRRVIERGDPVG